MTSDKTAWIVDRPVEGALFIDTRPKAAYLVGHVEGALALDLTQPMPRLRSEEDLIAFEKALAELFGRLGLGGEQRPVVLYDEGLTSRLCRTAFLLGLGGLDVYLWPYGWENLARDASVPSPDRMLPNVRLRRDWLLTADEAARHPRLYDVRGYEEYVGAVHPPCCPRGGRIPGARNAPLPLFYDPTVFTERTRFLERLGVKPGEEVGVYCHSGARSAVAFFVLRELGVRARNYLGSMHEWLQEGLPVDVG
ncbi:MAG: thiosulfate sulfurtransferase [Hydrogenibacillus sp.]|nr:thiosulfate sulfurtransferase [Hydrogenibacillus sp.]